MTILVTGSAGFIGANFVIDWLSEMDETVISLDKLTYAGNLNNLAEVEEDERHVFVHGDIGDSQQIDRLLHTYKPRAVVNFAAESHVDRSIHEPEAFLQTNIIGTFRLLESSRRYCSDLNEKRKRDFRFLHVSTDEVYGSLDEDAPASTESKCYQPNNPYSASKASSEHLVRAYYHTYGLPVLTTNCSNNYGPYQFPEKLIPLVIHNALAHKPLPTYGDGLQIRDWLYVGDHCRAIRMVLDEGSCGEVYNIGGLNEKANIEVVRILCDILNELRPVNGNTSITSYHDLITFVKDRPGHDRRYAIDASKIETELGWRPAETFATGIQKTVEWYLDNQEWVDLVLSGDYHQWIERQYA
ncbi:dTDP-glucose 4,6-dehydratase [Salinisphaera sp. G21_0]|uniref:dTDP-glucose 4,6-dehydratase n=1 Tax=Salinisphaera sp. G21_0 TaxID=2821094 RepID=UPI001AD9FD73|nr:dTDP-glucose 4,6-dehydratase [Salinisphaera sp. G21_0]MBO9484018.1 dTDP-glucose 4,6-dehydratase [Salinisphaera sp. G21_0]